MNPTPDNEILTLLTRENITLALSIFGAIGALITFISSAMTSRKNLRIKITKSAYRSTMGMLILIISFENRSSLPIAVTAVDFLIGKKVFSSYKYPQCVEEYTHTHGEEVVDRKILYNLNFPIDIQQFSSSSGYVLLEIPQQELEKISTPVIVQVHSTRGRVQKRKLTHDSIKYC